MRSRMVRWLAFAAVVCTLSLVGRKTAGQTSGPWPPDASQYKLYMIGNAHIDIPWLWPWPESMMVGLSTFRAALDRMNEFPEFKFTASSAILYEWAASADPGMLVEIRKRVAEGRWGVVGGWMVEPDVNIPNGESLIRQGLYGQRDFQRLLGRMSRVGFNPDSFGHPGTLPQILKLQGMNAYVFMRPAPHEKQLPADVFWWKGGDGTRVLTYRIPNSYGITTDIQDRMHDFVTKLHEPTKDLMVFYGAGDHGGGPAKETIRLILDAQKQPGAPQIVFSTPERYFEDIGTRNGAAAQEFPVVDDDLQHHSVGCYTAVSQIKKDNRTTEAALATGEKIAALANVLVGFPYPKADFADSWKKVLLMQFHDSMAGTALPEQYVVSHNAYGFAQEVANQAIYRGAAKIAWQIPTTDPASEYLVVFNPHAWAAKLNVQYDLGWGFDDKGGTMSNSRLEDEQGNAIPHQWVAGQTVIGDRKGLVFQAPVPAFGYRQFRLHKVEPAAVCIHGARHREGVGERTSARDVQPTMAPSRCSTKMPEQKSFVEAPWGRAPWRLTIPAIRGVTMLIPTPKTSGRSEMPVSRCWKMVWCGPRCACGRPTVLRWMTTNWMFYAGARTLEARVSLDRHEHLKILKFSFPVDVQNPTPTYEIAYGFRVRQGEWQ